MFQPFAAYRIDSVLWCLHPGIRTPRALERDALLVERVIVPREYIFAKMQDVRLCSLSWALPLQLQKHGAQQSIRSVSPRNGRETLLFEWKNRATIEG
jgi:hypothetical protein